MLINAVISSRFKLNFWLFVCSVLFPVYSAAEFELIKQQPRSGGYAIVKIAVGSRLIFKEEEVEVDGEGYAALAFNRELAGLHEIHIYPKNMDPFIEHIWVDTRNYNEQRIEGVDSSRVTPPVEVHERIVKEAKLVNSARAGQISHNYWREETFVWPVFGRISGLYGSQRFYNGVPRSPHWGVDIARPRGTAVFAPAGGTIVLAESDLYFSGGTVVLDHGGGLTSSFLHLSKIEIQVGKQVKQGQLIARIGSTGRSTGPHLDWRMNLNGERVDAELWVPEMSKMCMTEMSKMNSSDLPKLRFVDFNKMGALCNIPAFLNENEAQHWLKNIKSLITRTSGGN